MLSHFLVISHLVIVAPRRRDPIGIFLEAQASIQGSLVGKKRGSSRDDASPSLARVKRLATGPGSPVVPSTF